jgi:hypothetical protein
MKKRELREDAVPSVLRSEKGSSRCIEHGRRESAVTFQ